MSYIFKAIGTVLSWLSFGNSYLLAILLFALIIKILMFPFGIKQQKNSLKQASLRPKEMAIRKKYAGRENDRNAMNQMNMEVQEMYRANNYSPFSGCLPMLLQLPIIFIVYQPLYRPLTYICDFTASQITAIKDFIAVEAQTLGVTLSSKGTFTGSELEIASLLQKNEAMFAANESTKFVGEATIPNFSLFGVSLGDKPTFTTWLVIIPILVFAAQFLSSKLIRKMSFQPVEANQGCSMWIMDITMPLMIMFMAFTFPAFLGIYWIFQSLLSVLQQFILKKMYPYPTFTDEDYRNAERAMRGKGPKGGAGTRTLPSGKTYRSLHNIDADDE